MTEILKKQIVAYNEYAKKHGGEKFHTDDRFFKQLFPCLEIDYSDMHYRYEGNDDWNKIYNETIIVLVDGIMFSIDINAIPDEYISEKYGAEI